LQYLTRIASMFPSATLLHGTWLNHQATYTQSAAQELLHVCSHDVSQSSVEYIAQFCVTYIYVKYQSYNNSHKSTQNRPPHISFSNDTWLHLSGYVYFQNSRY